MRSFSSWPWSLFFAFDRCAVGLGAAHLGIPWQAEHYRVGSMGTKGTGSLSNPTSRRGRNGKDRVPTPPNVTPDETTPGAMPGSSPFPGAYRPPSLEMKREGGRDEERGGVVSLDGVEWIEETTGGVSPCSPLLRPGKEPGMIRVPTGPYVPSISCGSLSTRSRLKRVDTIPPGTDVKGTRRNRHTEPREG